ncbi:hypothetical protein BBJ28_00008454 [Nothophytophthora sp. Chile5]|nr:hypothetical protein BBJ28_00008454 [Nothophytophthora sp. Chile5]
MDVMMNMTTEDVRRLRGQFHRSLRLGEFVQLMRTSLRDRVHSEELAFVVGAIELFHTIDVNGDAVLDWDEFAAYMMDAGQAKADFYFEGRGRTAKHYVPLPLPPRDAKTPMRNIRTRVQQMRLLVDQNAVAYFELDSDVVYLYSLQFDRNEGPRHLSTIRLHTAFQEHTVIDVVYIPTHKSLVISSVLSRGYLSLWSVADLHSPVMTRRLESPAAQELLSWIPSLQSLVTSAVVFPSLFSDRQPASRRDSYRPNAGSDQPHTKISQLALWDVSGKVQAPAAGVLATKEVTIVQERVTGVTALAVYRSINRTYLAVGREDGILSVVDTESGEEVSSSDAHSNGVKMLVYSNEVERLASVGFHSYADETTLHISIWKKTGATGLLVAETALKQHGAPVEVLAFVDSKQQLVSVDRSETFNVYSSVMRTPTSEPWEWLQTFRSASPPTWSRQPAQRLWGLFAVPETAASDAVLVTAGRGVSFYDHCEVKDREELFFAYYSSTLNVVIGATSSKLLLWKGDTGVFWKKYEYADIVLAANNNPSLENARLSGKKTVDPEACEAQARALTAVCVDDRERKVILGDDTGSLKVLNAVNGNVMKELDPHHHAIVDVSYVLYQKRVISISADSVLHISDENNPLGFYVPFGGGAVQSVILQSLRFLSEVTLASVAEDESGQNNAGCRNEEPAKFRVVRSIGNQELNLLAVLVAGPQRESFIQVWNFDISHSQGTCVAPQDESEITCMSFFGSAAEIVGGTMSGRVFLWSPIPGTASYTCLMELTWSPATPIAGELEEPRHPSPITHIATVCVAAACSSDSSTVASSSPRSQQSTSAPSAAVASSSLSSKELARIFVADHTIDDRIRYESECGVHVFASDEAGIVTQWKVRRSRRQDMAFFSSSGDGTSAANLEESNTGDVRPSTQRCRSAASGAETAAFQHEEMTVSFDTIAALYHQVSEAAPHHSQARHPWRPKEETDEDNSGTPRVEIVEASRLWRAHSEPVLSLEVATDPCTVLTSSVSGQIKLWSVDGEPFGVLDHFATRRAPLDHPWTFPVDMAARRSQREAEAHEFLPKSHHSVWKNTMKPRLSILQERLSLSKQDLAFSRERTRQRKPKRSDVGRAVRHFILAQTTSKGFAANQAATLEAASPDFKTIHEDSGSLHSVLQELEQFQLHAAGSSEGSSSRGDSGDLRSRKYAMVTLADVRSRVFRPRTPGSRSSTVHCDLSVPNSHSGKEKSAGTRRRPLASGGAGLDVGPAKRKELFITSAANAAASSTSNRLEVVEYLLHGAASNQEKEAVRATSAKPERPRTRDAADGVLRYHVRLAHTWQPHDTHIQ